MVIGFDRRPDFDRIMVETKNKKTKVWRLLSFKEGLSGDQEETTAT